MMAKKDKKNNPIEPVDPNGILNDVGQWKRGGRVGSPSLAGYNAPRVVNGSPYGAPTNMGSGFGRTGSPSLGGYTNPRVTGGSIYGVPQPARQDYSMVPTNPLIGDWGTMFQRAAGLDAAPRMLVDPESNLPGTSTPRNTGGGSSGGGGGGGYGTNPDPLGWNAIAQGQALQTGYDSMLEALKAAAAAQSGSFDRSTAAINAGSEQARARQAQIVADLTNMSTQAAGRVGGVYGSANQDLTGLMDAYQRASQGRVGAAGDTLRAFGANPDMAAPGGSGTADFLAAQGAALARSRAADQGLLAGRQDVYGALGQDFAQRSDAWSQQQLAQVLAARQQAEAAAAREQAQLALDLELKKLELQQREQARRAQYG
jgi:hypothetical protein